MANFAWTCPFCDRDTIIHDNSLMRSGRVDLNIANATGMRILTVSFIVCPNTLCRRYTLNARLFQADFVQTTNSSGVASRDFLAKETLREWRLEPESRAKVYQNYIPQAIRDDYTEACAILEASPKASATLARRALQGMIRDFHKVAKPDGHKGPWSLFHEIDAIKERVEPEVWAALDALRKVGNIGAHMEQDVNVIVAVDPEEAAQLIGLIEMLLKDWYVNREQRKVALAAVTAIAATKEAAKKGSV